jgi:hypothetical protein
MTNFSQHTEVSPVKIGYKALLASFLAVALAVPAAAAKPGNGHGPPAWAGGGNSGPKAKDKPSRSERSQSKKVRTAAPANAVTQENGEDGPKHHNPAWVCKFERGQMGAEAFAEEYGSNEHERNAFGKCVSEEAHDRDGVAADDDEAEASESGDEEASVPDDSDDGDTGTGGALGALRALIQSLAQMMF